MCVDGWVRYVWVRWGGGGGGVEEEEMKELKIIRHITFLSNRNTLITVM